MAVDEGKWGYVWFTCLYNPTWQSIKWSSTGDDWVGITKIEIIAVLGDKERKREEFKDRKWREGKTRRA